MNDNDLYARKPNLFIVGASKCGTTSLYRYLQQHPQVFMPARKEPHFLSTDIPRPNRMSKEEYFALFEDSGNAKWIGEASADYLYSKAACSKIKSGFPNARIIIALRNPVDKIHSSHAYSVWLGRDNVDEFEKALNRDTSSIASGRKRTYVDSAKYSKYVRMYLETFGAKQVHIILFEEMVKNPQEVFGTLCEFLEIDRHVVVRFARHNPAKRARLQGLARVLLPSSRVLRLRRRVPRAGRWLLGTGIRVLRRWNTRFEDRVPMSPALRAALEREFTEDVEVLSGLVGRDLLAYWFPEMGRRLGMEEETQDISKWDERRGLRGTGL